MTYPCHRCNMDDGSPLCLQDERCPQKERNAYGPAHLAPQPAPGLAFDARGVLAPIARESVADALLIVKSYGPWGADLNDAHRRQIVLAEEVFSLRAALRQKRAEYEDMKSLLLGNARNLNLEGERARDVLRRMLEAPTTQISATWKDAARQGLVLGPNARIQPP